MSLLSPVYFRGPVKIIKGREEHGRVHSRSLVIVKESSRASKEFQWPRIRSSICSSPTAFLPSHYVSTFYCDVFEKVKDSFAINHYWKM